MEFCQHALEKCTLYGVNPELVREALTVGETFLDLTPDDARVITVCQLELCLPQMTPP